MQHGMPAPDETRAHKLSQELVTDFKRALECAAELQAIGSLADALIWERLADYLRTSEGYIFEEA